MLNPQTKSFSTDKIEESNLLSVVLLTQNSLTPTYQPPDQVISSVPIEISKEVIVMHYNFTDDDAKAQTILYSGEHETNQNRGQRIVHVRVKGDFAYAVRKGIEASVGKFILVMDADSPYSREIVPELIRELIEHPHLIIVASRFVKGAHIQRMPLVQSVMRKGARAIAKYGLKIKNVEDPTSSCFAFSRSVLNNINFEGKGKEALLEILVKVNTNKSSNIAVKEIPIKQPDTSIAKKANFARILNYSGAVWDLYRYGKASKRINEKDIAEQKKHRSILFLSKAGRFFTVGASGLLVNYVASFLLTTLVPGIWYIHATLFGIIISITSNFLLNKIWTFEDKDFSPKHFFKQYSLFMVLCALGAVIQLSLVYAFVEYSHIQYAVSLIMAVAIASLSNFLLNKKITFGEKIWE
jgi:dolichol-phosphate mannosyltransferase